jgi:hypothetical protein
MKANELKIGNYVNIIEREKSEVFDTCHIDKPEELLKSYFEIAQFSNDEIYLYIGDEEIEFSYNVVKPIPITEEWLLKLGFEFDDSVYEAFKDEFFLDRYPNSKEIKFSGFVIKHVHQLQNVYHALTGKELEIIKK